MTWRPRRALGLLFSVVVPVAYSGIGPLCGHQYVVIDFMQFVRHMCPSAHQPCGVHHGTQDGLKCRSDPLHLPCQCTATKTKVVLLVTCRSTVILSSGKTFSKCRWHTAQILCSGNSITHISVTNRIGSSVHHVASHAGAS